MKSVLLTAGQVVFTLALYVVGAMVLGLALFPAAMLFASTWDQTAAWPQWQHVLALCMAGAAGYFVFGFSLIAVVSILRIALGLQLKEGTYAMFSWGAIRWMLTNALQLIVWTFFGQFILLTPFAALLYRLMGAKLGTNVQINSSYCADLSLLEIGDGSVIGGHATVIAHAFERKGLVLKRVKIGKQVVVGLNAVILPGVEIGDRAIIAAGAVVPKFTKIEPGTIYVSREHEVHRPEVKSA